MAMAEGHQSEDAPLLGAHSPTHTSPAPPWPSTPPPPAPHDPPLPPWPPDHQWTLGMSGNGTGNIGVGQGGQGGHSPKGVRSQASMDSGCECDDGLPPPVHHHHHHHHHLNTPGLSPLSPSQPGGSGPPTPGPSDVASSEVTAAKVTFSFDGDDDDDDDDDRCSAMGSLMVMGSGMNAIESASLSGSEPGEGFREQVLHHSAGFPRVPSYSKTGVLSASSSTASMPMCRICHHPQGDGLDTLISPCRCAGTMQFIHQGCLNKWLEVKRCKKAPVCELCNYQFHRHKKFRLHHWQLPSCSRADKVLHSIFLVCLVVMATCATITIICFKQDRVPPKKDDAELTKSEVVTLTCGVLFFVAFFVAMYVEVKARNTLYRLFSRFLYLNQTWHIAEYDRKRDSQVAAGGGGGGSGRDPV